LHKEFGVPVKAIIFCGYHNSGKTTLLIRAIRGLVKRGYRVSTVKHTPGLRHEEVFAPTDSEQLFSAGSESTLLVTGEGALLKKRIHLSTDGSESLLDSVLKRLDSDFILIEGFKEYSGPIPKVLFVHHAEDLTGSIDRSTAAYSGVAAQESWSESIPFLSPSAGEDDLADFIEHTAYDLSL
jgi:molybdopterin-guanine dinucleotide biosynthesis protein MobB